MAETIQDKPIEQEMKESYIDYAMSVIVSRALPDVRDGLKPVHRRVLYAMHELSLAHNKPFKKSARIVGEILGKFHPHGDTAVYDTLVRMAQNFSLRYPLVDGQGNWGCFTGDTKIKLTDGRELSFKELIKEDKKGKKNYTYTVNSNGLIEIAEIKNPRLTKKKQKIVKLTLDNGKEIRCTLDHLFMLKSAGYKEAKDLSRKDSLMPISLRLSTKEDLLKPEQIGYEMIYQPKKDKWVPCHILADLWNVENNVYAKSAGRVRHHVDFNKLNNNPDNIKRMNWKDPIFRKKISKVMSKRSKKQIEENPNLMKELAEKAKISLRRKWRNPDYKQKVIRSKILNYVNSLLVKYNEVTPEIYERERSNNCIPRCKIALSYFKNFSEILEKARIYNHKVIDIEFLNKREDVYDIEIPNTHNFALAAGVFVHNSVDGDRAAAMRYTEARLRKIAEEILTDIEKQTVDFAPNFDGSLEEPIVLPAKLPNLLINGSTGIAVGMATNIPPHNLKEVADAVLCMIDNPEVELKELMTHVKGPDFPTGGIILGKNGIKSAYMHGRGHVKVRSKTHTEQKKDKERIIITEIPYMVNKSTMIENIASLVNDKKIIGITDIRDESDRKGMRVVLELKKNANAEVILNQLYKKTQMQVSFGITMLALHDNQPKVMGLKEILTHYIEHRKEVVIRRTTFELNKAEEKAHILEGLKVALQNIDDVVKGIKASKDPNSARQFLMSTYSLTEKQAQAILDMKLQKLTSLEQNKIQDEHDNLVKLIADLKDILASEQKIYSIIKQEVTEIKEKYGDDRRTEIEESYEEIETEDLIPEQDVVVTATYSGYIKRTSLELYKQQKRGGVGIKAAETKEEDEVEHIFTTSTHSNILCFSNLGRVYWLKGYELPEASRYARGTAIVNLLKLSSGERVNAMIPLKEFKDEHYLIMVTKKGVIKKTLLEEYSRPRKGGIIAIGLRENDELVAVRLTPGRLKFLIATAKGYALKFDEQDVRPMGRTASGVRGIKLSKKDEVIGLEVALGIGALLTVTENGYGKRSPISDYRLVRRGGKGVINIKTSERNGNVVGIKTVMPYDEILLISKNGVILRTLAKDISEIGRNTQGVRLMKLREGDNVNTVARVIADKK